MIETLKTTGLIALLVTSIVAIAVMLAPPSYASELGNANQTPQISQSKISPAPMLLAYRLKAPGRESRKKCNGSTTSECCKGLSKCSCLYMPGSSSDNHPTACFTTKKSSSSNRG